MTYDIPLVITGTSGAQVVIVGPCAIKYAPHFATDVVRQRLVRQDTFMRLLGPQVCPRVLTSLATGFVMERCEPTAPDRGTVMDQLAVVLRILEDHVWVAKDTSVTIGDINWGTRHWAYLEARVDTYCPQHKTKIHRAMEEAVHRTDGGDIMRMIHGDPTYDNIVFLKNQLLITDPLPPEPYMPALREVDVAKMMQSIIGYEAIKYDDPRLETVNPWVAGQTFFAHRGLDWYTVHYFVVVHILRLLPYQPEHLRDAYLSLLEVAVAYL